ncbi:MAG TPA: hypothetical protein VE954_03740 [Oligoflexus sp.]|uniref:hypothetical protein n=1 Tax=Oligoflexus sp. TaxID=1971216 RepID=UPI002D6C31F7|nr:hypothetical protein [Oligoflexus sp.]HYX32199.1 hypothetical protein [Oligoflexus sp.]
MEYSSIGTIFSQSKSLRQRIDSLQSMGYSPEEAIRKAKLGNKSQPKSKKFLTCLPRLRPNRVLREAALLAAAMEDRQAEKVSNFSKASSIAQGTAEAGTRLIYNITTLTSKKAEPDDFRLPLIKVISNACGTFACALALIYFGAEAGNFTFESWFWSILFVISSTTLLAVPFNKKSWECWVQKTLGLSLVLIGYLVIHTSIDSSVERTMAHTVSTSPIVLQVQASIRDLESRLTPTRKAIADMNPIEYRSSIAKLQRESKPLEEELARKRDQFIELQDKEKRERSSGLVSNWGFADWLRRLTLEPLNILCLHGLIESLPKLIKALRRRSLRFANAVL